MPLQTWDGVRPRLKRTVVTHNEAQIGQLGVIAASENLTEPTDWCFAEDSHKFVVHLDGKLDRMECTFSTGPSGPIIPRRGDIWIIPAGCRYAALAQGERAQFVELTVPTALLSDAPLTAQVGYRDDFLFGAASRLYDLIEHSQDDIASMAAHAISTALNAHLLDRFRIRRPATQKHRLSEQDRALLGEAIKGQLDARHSLGTLAALVDMEVRQFTAAFREAFGLTPWQYVLRARLHNAAQRLRQSNAAVTDIALTVGFATPSHFATAFTRHFGVPPSRYRLFAR
jgi:AraC family transcriptional regulator